MKNKDEEQKYLDYILKNGDILDLVSLKKGVKPESFSLFKGNLLLFSRILFLGSLIGKKIKAIFAPVEKVKEAQDKIRESIGVSIDIVRAKKPVLFDRDVLSYRSIPILSKLCDKNISLLEYIKKHLYKDISSYQRHPYCGILYVDENIGLLNYINNLKRILNFSKKHNINSILLNKASIYNFAPQSNVNFKEVDFSDILYVEKYEEYTLGKKLVLLTQEDLNNFIKMLETKKLDKSILLGFKKAIDDISIKKAIEDFENNQNIENLKLMIVNRLNLALNNNGVYRNKMGLKIVDNITIQGEYVKIESFDNNGILINNMVLTLYDYLQVKDYSSLFKKIKNNSDDKELLLISALYMYINNTVFLNSNGSHELSFYDLVYKKFKESQNKKNMKLMKNTKMLSMCYGYLNVAMSFCLSFFLICGIYLAGIPLTGLEHLIGGEKSNFINNIFRMVESVYEISYSLEESVLDSIFSKLEEGIPKLNDITGDSFNDEDREVAKVDYFNDEFKPTYFASLYATSAIYEKGEIDYCTRDYQITYGCMEEVPAVLSIEKYINKEDLIKTAQEGYLNFNLDLYPLGDNYVLTEITIKDEMNENNSFMIDPYSISNNICYLNQFKIQAILQMSKPIITYSFGISENYNNGFVRSVYRNNYNNLLPGEARTAIVEGLGLSVDATLEEIYRAIQSKDYSLTPIDDAGLTRKIKRMSEKEFYKTIAALDSTICNLAATMVVNVNDELIYTMGFVNNDDSIISTKEAHAWAINKYGDIIDATPGEIATNLDIQKVVNNVINFCLENNISLYAMIALLILILNKLFGKKVKLKLKVNNIEKVLTKPESTEAYALIKDILYGGINIPKERNVNDFYDVIIKELYGLNETDIKELIQKLSKIKTHDSKTITVAKKILKEVLLAKENREEIKQKLTRKRERY